MLSILGDVEANGGSFVESLVEDVKAYNSSLGYFLEKDGTAASDAWAVPCHMPWSCGIISKGHVMCFLIFFPS